MEFITPDEFPILCRICLSKSKPLKLLKEINISTFFFEITKIEIDQEEILPEGICCLCLKILLSVREFVEKCRASDEILRSALNRTDVTENNCTLETDNIHSYDGSFDTEQLSENSIEFCEEQDETAPGEKLANLSESHKKSWDCENCGEKFDQLKVLRHHYAENKVCKENRLKCNVCSKIFRRRYKLQSHMRSHTKETPFQCNICLKQFRFSQNLKRHRNIHEGIKPFVCPICDKAFARASMREDHVRIHTGEAPYICKYCGKSLMRYQSHRAHVIRHQLENGELPEDQKINEETKCKDCDKRFTSKSALRNHELLHTGERMYLCNDCGKNFFTKGALQSHFRVHTGIKPHKCSDCEKSFARKSALNNHVLTHMGLKPYSCKLCNKSFVQTTHLKNHMRTHSGEKPYICSYCGKGFAVNCNLKVHVRTHTGETPFHCSICSMGFYDSSTLKKHEKSHEQLLESTELSSKVENDTFSNNPDSV